MHLVLYEDLFGENQEIYFNKILYFLGLEDFKSSDTDRANRSMAMVPKKGYKRYCLKY